MATKTVSNQVTTIRASVNDTVESVSTTRKSRDFAQRTPMMQHHNKFLRVDTINANDELDSRRIIDLMHEGTGFWLTRKHLPWAASQQGFMVEIHPATQAEYDEYMKTCAEALQKKYA